MVSLFKSLARIPARIVGGICAIYSVSSTRVAVAKAIRNPEGFIRNPTQVRQ